MARIQMGVIVTDIRGKLAGNQFSKTRAGNILQRKCGQRKGATRAQSERRSAFSSFSRLWRSLSEADRIANNTNTSSYPVIDKFGNTTYLSGYQLLLRSNINLNSIGEAPINVVPGTPPAGAGLGSIVYTVTMLAGVVSEALIEWTTLSGDTANKVVVIYASPGVSAGVSNYNGRYTQLEQPVDPAEMLWDISGMFGASIAQPNVGDKLYVIVDLMDIATGIVVASYSASSIASV